MKLKVSLFNSDSNDVAVVIDLLRASTTVTLALNTFDKVIPVNNEETALQYKKDHGALLAGENDLEVIPGFDLSNSPEKIQNYSGDTLVLKTTNGTKVMEAIKNRNPDVKVYIGAGINARAIAETALLNATDEIELIMAGRHEKFNIEDAIGAGLIAEEIVNIADEEGIDIEIKESAKACIFLAEDHVQAAQFIEESKGCKRLSKKGYYGDVVICKYVNESNNVPVYENGEIRLLEK